LFVETGRYYVILLFVEFTVSAMTLLHALHLPFPISTGYDTPPMNFRNISYALQFRLLHMEHLSYWKRILQASSLHS